MVDETDAPFVAEELPADEPAQPQTRRPGRPTLEEQEERDPPRYLLLQPFYVNDLYIDADQEIEWRGIPNEAMEPLNASAERRMNRWRDSLPSKNRQLGDFVEEAYMNRPRAEEAAPRRTKPAHLMGVPTNAPTPKVIVQPQNRYKGPRKQMGTVVLEAPTPGSI